ncbi:hypothetical protein BG262_02285 [Floricoccus penangensis]|uniref:HTH cro/C1-type domain-containing protein n=1 Tax=Floricoccus penangensis TaxID=1859475 RepID=A0A9Q5JFY3_9LACT|nr:helix-turn-helix domain-containing protein [Floricoccus penangensis]OFI46652.1 hypothetical protein BG262_02285 [Floricoccus penangensis]
MKNVLDIYLKENGKDRSQLMERLNVSKKSLSEIGKTDPENYSADTIVAIANEMAVAPGIALDRMLEIRDTDIFYHVKSIDELKQKVKEQEDEFILEGDFSDLFNSPSKIENFEKKYDSYYNNVYPRRKTFLTNSQELGIILKSFSPTEGIIHTMILQEKILYLYMIKILNKNQLFFRLRQLDY